MMRNKSSSALQKTYDECYLICSTAVYFEGQVGCSFSFSCFLFITHGMKEGARGGN